MVVASRADALAKAAATPLNLHQMWLTGLPRHDLVVRAFDALPDDLRAPSRRCATGWPGAGCWCCGRGRVGRRACLSARRARLAGGLVPPPRRRPRRARGSGRPGRQPEPDPRCRIGALGAVGAPAARPLGGAPRRRRRGHRRRGRDASTSCSPAGRCCTWLPDDAEAGEPAAAASSVTSRRASSCQARCAARSTSWRAALDAVFERRDAERRVAYAAGGRPGLRAHRRPVRLAPGRADPPPVRRRLRPPLQARQPVVDRQVGALDPRTTRVGAAAVEVGVQQRRRRSYSTARHRSGSSKARSSAARRPRHVAAQRPGHDLGEVVQQAGGAANVVEVRREADDRPAGDQEVGELARCSRRPARRSPAAPSRRRGAVGRQVERARLDQAVPPGVRDGRSLVTGPVTGGAPRARRLDRPATQTSQAGRRRRAWQVVRPAGRAAGMPQHQPAAADELARSGGLLAQVVGQRRRAGQQQVGSGRPGDPPSRPADRRRTAPASRPGLASDEVTTAAVRSWSWPAPRGRCCVLPSCRGPARPRRTPRAGCPGAGPTNWCRCAGQRVVDVGARPRGTTKIVPARQQVVLRRGRSRRVR